MAERCVKGDYIGFTLGGVHSSELGLMRVSNGSRYEQDLLPPLQDKTAQVAGRDGAIYFGSQYNTKPIKVPVAFDNMTEESFNRLKRLLQDKKPKYLWFDETPYKQWLVKAANVQNFKWVCFDETKNGGEKRIYKGEGTLEFSCFTPYAESRVTFLDDPVDSVWVWNITETPKKLITTSKPFYKNKNLSFREHSSNNVCIHTSYKQFYFNEDMQLKNSVIAIPCSKDYFNIYIYKDSALKVLYNYRVLAFAENDTSTFDLVKVARDLSWDTDLFGVNQYWITLNEDGTGLSRFKSQNIDKNVNTFFVFGYRQGKYITNDGMEYYQMEDEIEQPTLKHNYNYEEWKETSNLRNNIEPNIYNAGDIPTNTFISFTSQLKEKTTLSLYSSSDLTNEVGKIVLKPFELKGDDIGFIIDSKLKTIKGFKISEDGKSRIITNNIYNKYHVGGDYFKIPVCADDEFYVISSTSENEFTVDYKHYYI